MASSQKYSPKSQKAEEPRLAITIGKDDNSERRLRQEISLRRELHKSFDLNQTAILPTTVDSEKHRNFLIEHQNGVQNKIKAGKRNLQSDNKKKRLNNMKTRSARDKGVVANGGMDLELRLSASYSSSALLQNQSNSSMPSSDLSYDHEGSDFAVSKAAEVPLVLMGCRNCYLYVMVPKNEPKCPKCGNHSLIDLFQGNNSAKRSRSS